MLPSSCLHPSKDDRRVRQWRQQWGVPIQRTAELSTPWRLLEALGAEMTPELQTTEQECVWGAEV